MSHLATTTSPAPGGGAGAGLRSCVSITTEQFIARAHAVHGDRYDYSQVVYSNSSTNVAIICSQHGVFEQAPSNHLKGKGCRKCGHKSGSQQRAYSIAAFIAKARVVHGDKYDYSETNYFPSPLKIIIRCPQHGTFEQVGASHLMGHGCKFCGISKIAKDRATTTYDFVVKARATHGDKFDYSQVVYVNNTHKIKIVCPEHGAFKQAPIHHLSGWGCPTCALKCRAHRGLDLTKFIARARAVHGDRYDYSQVIYSSSSAKVAIICLQHGVFEQSPNNHFAGKGCGKCAVELRGRHRASNTANFTAQARAMHGDRYDYSRVVYSNNSTNVAIICLQHGVFEQSPSNHLQGKGCPGCKAELRRLSWIEQAKNQYSIMYLLRVFNSEEEFFKVGITCRSVKQRFAGKKALAGYQYEVLAIYKSQSAAAVYDWEQSIIETFAHLQYRPKTYFAGETECFSSAAEILSIFPL